MKMFFYTEARYVKASDGLIYNPNGVQNLSIFKRYLDVFEEVYVVARVINDNDYKIKANEIVENDFVKVISIPYYLGPLQYLLVKKKIDKLIKKIVLENKNQCHLLRIPGNIGRIAFKQLQKYKVNYGVEVVGDPFEVFKVSFFKNPFQYYLKYKLYFNLKKITSYACCAIYVTQETLQKRYPNHKMFSASNVKIKQEEILHSFKKHSGVDNTVNIISIGTLEQMYKSPDILIKLIKKLNDNGIDAKLKWLGKGKHLEEMVQLSKESKIAEKVNFLGQISDKNSINEHLDHSDVFVLASKTEGLPRVIIEAFARGLPVIATNVGGIPELMPKELLVNVDDVDGFYKLVVKLITEPNYYENISKTNLEKSKMFVEGTLQQNRMNFLTHLKKQQSNV